MNKINYIETSLNKINENRKRKLTVPKHSLILRTSNKLWYTPETKYVTGGKRYSYLRSLNNRTNIERIRNMNTTSEINTEITKRENFIENDFLSNGT